MDAVITWVNGSDPIHKIKRRNYISEGNWHSRATEDTRFSDSGEIYYCIASILKYTSFFRKIWLVTDSQRPENLEAFSTAGFCSESFIQIVDHRVIFRGFEENLPSFNSLSIESLIHLIPELSEKFVYFNDDCFINRIIEEEHFFRNDRPVIRGQMVELGAESFFTSALRALRGGVVEETKVSKPSFRAAQKRSAAMAGITGRFLKIGHTPHPLRKSVISEFYDEHPDVLPEQISFRFRSAQQYSPIALANHLEIQRYNTGWFEPSRVCYLKPHHIKAATLCDLKNGLSDFGCVQSLDRLKFSDLENIRNILQEKLKSHLPKEIMAKLKKN